MPKGWPSKERRNNRRKNRRQRHVPTQAIMSRMLELPEYCCLICVVKEPERSQAALSLFNEYIIPNRLRRGSFLGIRSPLYYTPA
jgi:hypothetical protein